jgi:hypothetical protein
MRAIIRSVDSEAAAPGSYWPDYADEVGAWMYGLDEVVEWHQSRHSSIPSLADSLDPTPSTTEVADDRLF